MSPIIHFTHVSKTYKLHRQQRPRSLREAFVQPFQRRANPQPQANANLFWALRDVSFNIQPGETVGLIGPNGAGKSTTLKLLSRVIAPSRGTVAVNGRVAALLELGTGFHPDLSGRDNVFLSAALIGLSHAEMQRKYPAVVDFSELGEFMEVPVKHYSSGMFARLAFSVSIYLEPEILLVDEVLAVGDISFQQKCLERLEQLKAQGITICLVSHDLGNVEKICQRAIWFDHGQIQADGPADSVIRQYLNRLATHESDRLLARNQAAQTTLSESGPEEAPAPADATASAPAPVTRWGTQQIEITQLRLFNAQHQECALFHTDDTLVMELDYLAHTPIAAPIFGMALHRQDGVHITGPNTRTFGLTLPTLSGRGTITYTVPQLALLEGLYHISVAVVNNNDSETYDYHHRILAFRVVNRPPPQAEQYGLLTLRGTWAHRDTLVVFNGNVDT